MSGHQSIDARAYLTSEEVCEKYGFGFDALRTLRESGAPHAKIGKHYMHDARLFDLWYQHNHMLLDKPAIGCREVVTGPSGVLGIIDLTGRWFPTTLLLLACFLSGCKISESTRKVEATASVADVDWTGRQGAGSFSVTVSAGWAPNNSKGE